MQMAIVLRVWPTRANLCEIMNGFLKAGRGVELPRRHKADGRLSFYIIRYVMSNAVFIVDSFAIHI